MSRGRAALWRALALLALSGCAPRAVRAPQLPAPVRWTSVDQLLDGAESLYREVQSSIEPDRSGLSWESCRSSFTVAGMMAQARPHGTLPAEFLGKRPTLAMLTTWYFVCRAMAADDADECGPLNAFFKEQDLPWDEKMEDNCNANYLEMMMFESFIARKADARARCIDSMVHPVRQTVSKELAPKFCDLMVRGLDQKPADACQALAPYLSPERLAKCPGLFGSFHGDSDCAGMPAGESRYICGDNAAYYHARTAGDAELCGSSGFCRVMMGGSLQDCAQYEKRLGSYYCSLRVDAQREAKSGAAPAGPSIEAQSAYFRRREEFNALIGRAQRQIEAADKLAPLQNEALLAAVDERAERAADLLERYRKLGEAFAGPAR